MSLKTGTAPTEGLTVVMDAIQNITVSPAGAAHAAFHTDSETTEITSPIQVFTLNLDDIKQKDLKKAYPTGWRYIILQDGSPVTAAEVTTLTANEINFSHFNTGPFVEGITKTIIQAEGLVRVNEEDYEARVLSVPALYVMALWLHGEANDLIIPIPPTNAKLEDEKTYSPQDFFTQLINASESRKNSDENPGAGRN